MLLLSVTLIGYHPEPVADKGFDCFCGKLHPAAAYCNAGVRGINIPGMENGIFSRPDAVKGIIAIRNLRTGSVYLKETEDAVRSFRDERFRLDLSMHECAELQAEYSSLGLELFTIDLDAEAGDGEDLGDLLERRKEHYRESGVRIYSGDPCR